MYDLYASLTTIWWNVRCMTPFHPFVGHIAPSDGGTHYYACMNCDRRWELDDRPKLATIVGE